MWRKQHLTKEIVYIKALHFSPDQAESTQWESKAHTCFPKAMGGVCGDSHPVPGRPARGVREQAPSLSVPGESCSHPGRRRELDPQPKVSSPPTPTPACPGDCTPGWWRYSDWLSFKQLRDEAKPARDVNPSEPSVSCLGHTNLHLLPWKKANTNWFLFCSLSFFLF